MKKTVPHYSCTLPVSKNKIEFRPLLVKEEKYISQINELSDSFSDQLLALTELVDSCCDGKINSKNISIYDFQYILTELRKKSVTETIQIKILCPYTQEPVVVDINLNEQETTKIDLRDKKELMLDGNIKLTVKTPTVLDLIQHKTSYDYNKDLYPLLSSCLLELETETQTVNLEMKSDEDKTYVLESLSRENFKILKEFITEGFLVLKLNYVSSDGVEREVIVTDFINFLRFYLVTLT